MTGVPWSRTERPCVNHWYRTINGECDYWKIIKDYHSKERNITYYKIVEYYNGDQLFCGKSLASVREIMRQNTWKKVEDNGL